MLFISKKSFSAIIKQQFAFNTGFEFSTLTVRSHQIKLYSMSYGSSLTDSIIDFYTNDNMNLNELYMASYIFKNSTFPNFSCCTS